MNQPPFGPPPPHFPHPNHPRAGAPVPPAKSSPVRTAAIVAASILGAAAFVALVVFMAKFQAGGCDEALTAARTALARPVDGSDDKAAVAATDRAATKCSPVSERSADVEALKATLARRAELGKSFRARPAMLAAGYRPEQLDRTAMVAACRAKNLYVVEMVASNVAGEPHYWDCEPNAVFGTIYSSPSDCTARKLGFGTIEDDDRKSVGVCQRSAPAAATAADAAPGAMRIKAGAWVGTTTKAKLEKAVEISASGDRAAFETYIKREPGVFILAAGTDVILVDLDGILFGSAKIRRKGSTQELWVQREALESP